MNTRQKVLEEALKIVNGEREKQYGSPEDNFRRIADLWSTYLTSLFEDEKVVVDIDPIDVAKMMILFKIARSNGDKDKLDNYVDILGYGACAAEIFEKSEEHPIAKPCDHIEVADECRVCDYAEKCVGTGVCLKETEKKLLHKSNKDKYDSFLKAYGDIVAHISLVSANVDQFDVVDHLTRNGHAPTEMAAQLVDGELNIDDVASYIYDAINEIKKEDKK